MTMKKLFNQSKTQLILEKLFVADKFWNRTQGLLGRNDLAPNEGLWLLRCNSIHTFFMKFAIDCIFVDRKMKVVGLKSNVRPWRLLLPLWRAAHVIELAAGTIKKFGIEIGDQLNVVS